jgi:hypothetical protein
VLVCTYHTVLEDGEDTYVYYSDGTSGQSFEFIKRTPYGHAILLVYLYNLANAADIQSHSVKHRLKEKRLT